MSVIKPAEVIILGKHHYRITHGPNATAPAAAEVRDILDGYPLAFPPTMELLTTVRERFAKLEPARQVDAVWCPPLREIHVVMRERPGKPIDRVVIQVAERGAS